MYFHKLIFLVEVGPKGCEEIRHAKDRKDQSSVGDSAVVLEGVTLKQNGEKRGSLRCFYILHMPQKLQIAAFCPFLYS